MTGRKKKADALTAQHRVFALEFLANGRNATRAYMVAYPRASEKTAAVEGSRFLRKPKIAAFIDARTKKVVEQLEYSGEQAMKGIADFAQVDIRRLYDKKGNLLPVPDWPQDVADAVKSIQPTPFGVKVTFYDKLSARIQIARAAGKLTPKDSKRRVTLAMLLGNDPLPEGE